MVTGLYIGRFQPFHNGHLAMVKYAIKQNDLDHLIIVIGSAEMSHDSKNPFTSGERYQMIRDTLLVEDYDLSGDNSLLDYVSIIPVDDSPRANLEWCTRVITHCPKFDVVFTNQSLVRRLFKDAGYKVRGYLTSDRKNEQGSVIRKMMVEGNQKWRTLVPSHVSAYIDEIDGVSRMMELEEKDC